MRLLVLPRTLLILVCTGIPTVKHSEMSCITKFIKKKNREYSSTIRKFAIKSEYNFGIISWKRISFPVRIVSLRPLSGTNNAKKGTTLVLIFKTDKACVWKTIK